MENKWRIVHDMDGDNGEAAQWVKEINHSKYGKFVWITETENGTYDVDIDKGDFETLVTCKTITSAKRWVTINIG